MKPIFIFSLPRSGSTLLQRILANSEQISTVSEPWILLPFAYTLKPEGTASEYGHRLTVKAIEDFYKGFPNGRKDYLQEMRSFILKLYQKNSHANAKYFLDKTPRYHLIINEIFELFPDGKFIFLWRNPLAVVASIVNSWCKGKWKPMVWDLDLHDGINNLINAYSINKAHVHSVQYENIIKLPSIEIEKICDYLDIEYHEKMITYFQGVKFDGQMGDKTGIKKYNSLSDNSLHNWTNIFNNPIRRYWAKKYLKMVGEENLKIIGYNYPELMSALSDKSINSSQVIKDFLRSTYYKSSNILSWLALNSGERAKHLYY